LCFLGGAISPQDAARFLQREGPLLLGEPLRLGVSFSIFFLPRVVLLEGAQ
jgi:hypothetical protein